MSNTPQIITFTGYDLERIEQCGSANFSIRQIAKVIGKSYVLVKKELTNKESVAYEHYERGILEKKLDIATKLADKARTGSMTAIQQDDKLRQEAEFDLIKSQIFDI